MSSWLSTATQKAKESIGVSSRTVDADVEAGLVRLAALEKDVGLLRKTLETVSTSLTVHAPGARAQMTDVMTRLGDGYVEDGVQFRSFRDAHETLNGPVVQKLSSTFQAAVLQPLDEWVASFSDVRSGTVELEKVRVAYDHYKEKLAGIKRDKDATLLKGKVFDKASEEKLQRNVEKLKEVRQPGAGATHLASLAIREPPATPAPGSARPLSRAVPCCSARVCVL